MLIPILQKTAPGAIAISDFRPSSVIQRHESDIWIRSAIMEGASNLVALIAWMDKGDFDEVRSVEESFVGGCNPAEILAAEPARFLGFCLASLKDQSQAAMSALYFGSSMSIFERITNHSVEGLRDFFRGELREFEGFYPKATADARAALAKPGILDGFYASREDISSGSKTVRIRSSWLGVMSPSSVDAPDFILSPALTLEEGFKCIASPPVGRMNKESFDLLSADLTSMVAGIESIFRKLAGGGT